MSIVDSFSKALEAIVARSVSYGEMGSGAIYTKSGVIFSNTDHPGVFNGVDEMPHGLLRDALKKAYDAAGVYCPKANLDLEDDEEDEHGHRGHKVNVRRFEAQKHGLPPLPEGWCIIIERHHLVLDVQVGEAINSIQNFGIVAAAGLLIATMLIAVKLFYVLRSAKRMQREMQLTRRSSFTDIAERAGLQGRAAAADADAPDGADPREHAAADGLARAARDAARPRRRAGDGRHPRRPDR
eukprot:2415612-Pleurochrysis_carterae.AAC.2